MLKSQFNIILFSLSVLLSHWSYAQAASIQGYLPGGENAEIHLVETQDYISYGLQVIGSTTVNDSGYFSFDFEVFETRKVFLEIHHYSIGLYIEKGGVYNLSFDSIDLVDEFRPLYNYESLICQVKSEPAPGLNNLISEFNMDFNEFVTNEFGGIYQRRNTNILKQFREVTMLKYQEYEHDFLNMYIIYKIAGIEIAMAPAKKPALFKRLIQDHEVLLFHPEYMAFFNSFFQQHIYPDNRFIPRIDLYTTINQRADYYALLDSLGKDSTLRNEKIRELACLKLLGELYYNPDFSKQSVLTVLDQIKFHTKFDQYKSIADNLRSELTQLEKGFSPPGFSLPSLDGNVINLSQLKGKPVYINFFTSWSTGCLAELELMDSLREEYKSSIDFVSISFDKEMDIVQELTQEKGYDWVFLFNGGKRDLINNYRIKTFPVFLLLDQDGNLVDYPAYKPSEVIRDSFDRLLGSQ